jgi:hypothetical protein
MKENIYILTCVYDAVIYVFFFFFLFITFITLLPPDAEVEIGEAIPHFHHIC